VTVGAAAAAVGAAVVAAVVAELVVAAVVAEFVAVAKAVVLRVLIQQSWKRMDSKTAGVDAIAGAGAEAAQTMASFGSGVVRAYWEDNGQLH
jgi:hypothetical protein